MAATIHALAGGTLEELDRAECLRLLATAPVGRIVFTHRALPAVQPVNFLLEPDGIVMRIRRGSALASVAGNTVVAFQADAIDTVHQTGWTVTVVGRAEEIADEADRARIAGLLRPWAGGERDHLVRVSVGQVTGRRLSPAGCSAAER